MDICPIINQGVKGPNLLSTENPADPISIATSPEEAVKAAAAARAPLPLLLPNLPTIIHPFHLTEGKNRFFFDFFFNKFILIQEVWLFVSRISKRVYLALTCMCKELGFLTYWCG